MTNAQSGRENSIRLATEQDLAKALWASVGDHAQAFKPEDSHYEPEKKCSHQGAVELVRLSLGHRLDDRQPAADEDCQHESQN